MESLPRLGRHIASAARKPRLPFPLGAHISEWCHPATASSIRSLHVPIRHNHCRKSNILRCLNLHSQPYRLSQSQLRRISTKPLPSHRGPVVRFLYRFFAFTGLFILTTGGLVFAFFVYDATTYKDNCTISDIPVSEHALSPRRGGPKNLPIASVLVDDEDSPEMAAQRDKPKMVILGTGWGSIALLKTLNPGDYHVTVVSPVNHFLFTPMLPSATVGTLEFRSLVEPVRRIVQRVRGHFLQAEAESVDFSEKLVEVSQVDCNGNKVNFYLPYDKLVIGVGKSCFPTRCRAFQRARAILMTS
jgi:NADH:ubiquinone reductase (H+-translocating)